MLRNGLTIIPNLQNGLEAMRVIDDQLIVVVRMEGLTQTLQLKHPTMYPSLDEANSHPGSGPECSMGSLGERQRRGLTRFGFPSLWNSPAFHPAVLGKIPVLFDRGSVEGPSFHCFRSFHETQNASETAFMVKAIHPLPVSFGPLPAEGENVLVGSWFIKLWYDEEAHCLDVKVAKFQSSTSPPTWTETEDRPVSWIVNPFLILTDIWRGIIYVREETAMHGELRALEFVDPL